MSNPKLAKLQGKVLDVQKTGEKRRDNEGKVWEKCIFTVELIGFSKKTSDKMIPSKLVGKVVKIVRWCCFNWHYKKGVIKTLEQDETEAIIKGKESGGVYY